MILYALIARRTSFFLAWVLAVNIQYVGISCWYRKIGEKHGSVSTVHIGYCNEHSELASIMKIFFLDDCVLWHLW